MTCVVMIVVPPFDSVSVFVCTCVVVIVTWPRSESVFVVLEPLVVTDGGTGVVREELVGLGLPELLTLPLDDEETGITELLTVPDDKVEPVFVELLTVPLDDEEVAGIPELLLETQPGSVRRALMMSLEL